MRSNVRTRLDLRSGLPWSRQLRGCLQLYLPMCLEVHARRSELPVHPVLRRGATVLEWRSSLPHLLPVSVSAESAAGDCTPAPHSPRSSESGRVQDEYHRRTSVLARSERRRSRLGATPASTSDSRASRRRGFLDEPPCARRPAPQAAAGAARMRSSKAVRAAFAPSPMATTICLNGVVVTSPAA